MQLLPMGSSPDGLISARHAVITKTPGWGVLTTTSNVNATRASSPMRDVPLVHCSNIFCAPPFVASALQ